MKKNNKKFNGGNVKNNCGRNEGRIRGIKGGARGRGKGGIYSKKITKTITTVQPHQLEGAYIIKSDKEYLATKNMCPGESIYGEELITIEEEKKEENKDSDSESSSKNMIQVINNKKEEINDSDSYSSSEDIEVIKKNTNINKNNNNSNNNSNNVNKIEYRIWDPYYSKLGAAIENGINNIFIKPGSKVLFLGAGNQSYSTISHISDLVGKDGIIYGVEYSEIKGLDLKNMAKKRENIIPIIYDARKPYNYKNTITNLVDYILADISTPDISSIISINSEFFLKNKGGFICIINDESKTSKFDEQIKLLREYNLYVKEFISLEPFKAGSAVVTGLYKPYREMIDED